MSVENWTTGETIPTNKNRSKRVQSMLQNKTEKKNYRSKVNPTWKNKFFNLFSNKEPIPQGTFRKVPRGGGLTNYNKRALSFLSERSVNVAKSNLNRLNSKRNKRTLSKALNITRKKK
jgi:hypothetical protein